MLTWVDFGLACSEQRAVVAAVFDNLAFSTRQSALRGALRAFHSGMTSHKSFRMLVPPGGGGTPPRSPASTWAQRDRARSASWAN